MRSLVEPLVARARAALTTGDEAAAGEELARWLATNRPDPELQHWLALLLRAQDLRGEALPLLRDAAAAAPADAAIAHSLAQVTLEAGLPAAALFETALRLNPASSDVRLGLVSARFEQGQGEQALLELGAALANNPGWFAGHRQFGQLCALLGLADGALQSLERTVAAFPAALEPWLVAAEMALSSRNYPAALDLLDRAALHHSQVRELEEFRAEALDELHDIAGAAAIYAALGEPADAPAAIRRLRHCLRLRDPARAIAIAEPWLASAQATQVWPYVALAWRLQGDRHAEWLEGQAGLIGEFDLDPAAIGLGGLTLCLDELHARSGRFLDQSVRGGTQTSGALFARIEPPIKAIRTHLSGAVASHVAALAPPDAHHPQLAPRRDRAPRFSGSWSVRLSGSGHHASHYHPEGWFSSAFYVAVPEGLAGREGQLELGVPPPELGLELGAIRRVEPRPGRLAIFPSTMWHGTLPFSEGTRMTIAFDVAYPYEDHET